jgi:hypothetical protein
MAALLAQGRHVAVLWFQVHHDFFPEYTMNTFFSILNIACVIFIPAIGAASNGESFSYGLYAKVLDRFVDGSGRVDYHRLKAEKQDLDSFIQTLADVDPVDFETWSDEAQIAFWLNAYNALTIRVILDNYPIKSSFFRSLSYPKNSIRQIGGVWDKITFLVMGDRLTLDQIEHQILRQKFSEPRIHMALVCAAKSCPYLRQEPYEGSKLDFQLETQTRTFLSQRKNYSLDIDRQTIYLSSIFKWFGEDFIDVYKPESGFAKTGNKERAILYFVSLHVPEEDRQYLEEGKYSIRYSKYDWSLNERNPL